MRLLMVAIILGAAVFSLAPVELSAKDAPPKVSVLLQEANELMSQAQSAYIDGDSKVAIEKYREALQAIEKVEQQNAQRAATAEFAPLRFRKALCETEVDRIMLEDANVTARTMAVTDTSALEKKVADRKRDAATNAVAPQVVELGAKQEPGVERVATTDVEVPAAEMKAGEDKLLDVPKELEWAKDMLVMDRFAEVDQAVLKVLKADPSNREARILMALSCVQQGKHVDAAVVLDGLLDDNANDEAVLLLAGGACVSAGNYARAMTLLDQALKLNPQRPDGYFNMAWLLLEMNPTKTTDAELYYRQAVKLGGTRDRDLEKRLGIQSE